MSNMFDIFNGDAFKVSTLTLAMKDIRYVPHYVSSLGLFSVDNIDTLDVAIEKDATSNLFLVKSSPRGGVGQTFGRNSRSMRKLAVPHFQVDDAIYADEVQSVRAFGDAYAVETFQARVAKRAAEVSQSFAMTEEFHKLSVITKGQLLDADNSVIYDYFAEMGGSAPTAVNFHLDQTTPGIRAICAGIIRAMGNAMAGLPWSGTVLAICGDAFWDKFVTHAEVERTYLNWQAAAELRQKNLVDTTGTVSSGAWATMKFAEIEWVNYRGGEFFGIDPDKVYFVPLGVPDLFKTAYAPADYIETVNRPGQRLYAKLWQMANEKGVNREFQTNALHYCTRPAVLMSGLKQ